MSTMGKRKRNRRPRRPQKEGPARTSSTSAAAGTGGGPQTPVASSAGAQDPSPGHTKTWEDINGLPRARPRGGGKPTPPPRARKRGGGEPLPPSRRERGGAANRHAPKITHSTIFCPVSAALTHVIIDVSTLGQRGCVRRGDLGAGALRMARHGAHH